MPRGDKSSYTNKQKRKAAHIAEGYKEQGVSSEEADARAWATVNKEDGGGNKSGSGRGVPDKPTASRKGSKTKNISRARRAGPARKTARPQKHGGTARH